MNRSQKANYLVILLLTLLYIQSCVIDKGGQYEIKTINNSKSRVYVNSLNSDCDSCDIQRDVEYFCSSKSTNEKIIDVINPNDSLVEYSKSTYVKIYVINADSLDNYCKIGSTHSIAKEKWVSILSSSIDLKTKTYFILIK